MHNFNEKHLQVIESVGCRYKICEGSILKYQKRQDVDAFVYDRQTEKHLQVQRRASCRYIGLKRASATMNIKAVLLHQLSKKHLRQRINRGYRYINSRKVNPSSFHLFQSRYITKQEKDYAIQRIGVGLA